MATSGPDEPTVSAGDRNNGPRPLKSRPEDRIASIMDNPFYKSFGVRHPRSPRDVPSAPSSAKTTADTDGKYGVREDLGDYRPGSGFVHKLMGRFASLEVKEESSISHLKNASSVEDILDRTGQESRAADTHERPRERGRFMSLSNNVQHRARSVESVNRRKGSLNLPVVLRHVQLSQDHSSSSLKSPRDSHIVAPDVKLGRDDIILIENPPAEAPPNETEDENNATSDAHSFGFHSENSTDELPKPNTVSAVRSLFESGKPLSPTSTSGGLEGESSFTPRDSVLTPRDSIVTPRRSSSTPRDSALTPRDTVLTPRDSVFTQDTVSTPREQVVSPKDLSSAHQDSRPYKPPSPRITTDMSQRYDASKSRFSWSLDHKTAATGDASNSTVPPPLPTTLPPVSATAVSSAAEGKGESDIPENAKSSLFQSAENHPVASPRSTAAVKAIPVSRPSVATRTSRPNSTSVSSSGTAVPPSFTPSLKKTSPVMPVAPFKENKADEGGDNRYLIYAKKSSNTKLQKVARLKDYGEGSTDLTADNTKNAEGTEASKRQGNNVKKSNKMNGAHAKGRAPAIPKQRQSEERVLSPRLADSGETPWTDVLKPTSPRIEDSQPQTVTLTPVESAKPIKAPRTFSSKPTEKMETNQSLAPSETSKMDTEETAKAEVKAEESNQPVKGIPSIIANRMKQNDQKQDTESPETRPPGELFGVRLGKTHHEKDSAEENEIPRKRLTPAAQKSESNASTNLPSEIENQIASVRRRMEHASRNKAPGVSQIFDSSQLQKKRKEKQAAKSSSAAGVPRLDLSSITAEDSSSAGSSGGYRVTPREIKPCNIVFIGANVSVGRSLLKKSRKEKVHIHFPSKLSELFEYPSEEAQLEEYLKNHPNEVLTLEEDTASWPTESSSDDADLPETPRGGGSSLETELKSNTSLAHTGSLQSYRGKFQQEYELGSVLNLPEKEPEPSPFAEPEPENPDAMQLLPADEVDNQTWSLETSSDLLF
ncbi:uncharacterized protein LOC143289661 [Babylonia areolata]|uniref:uncharacterized protein LOC143289661 n=1 Tax=Babylonia areolata TaxID=304850 RepID=UPI003FD4C96E